VHLGVAFDPADEGGTGGQDAGIDEAQRFMGFSSSSSPQEYRDQERILRPQDVSAEVDREGVVDGELLLKRPHGSPSRSLARHIQAIPAEANHRVSFVTYLLNFTG